MHKGLKNSLLKFSQLLINKNIYELRPISLDANETATALDSIISLGLISVKYFD